MEKGRGEKEKEMERKWEQKKNKRERKKETENKRKMIRQFLIRNKNLLVVPGDKSNAQDKVSMNKGSW